METQEETPVFRIFQNTMKQEPWVNTETRMEGEERSGVSGISMNGEALDLLEQKRKWESRTG